MNLPFLEWSRTPWGKATGGQWRYALRNSLAMCLALWVAFVLELDEPYWALTSAAVVSFPTIGGVISKSIGRIFGSLVGAFYQTKIVEHIFFAKEPDPAMRKGLISTLAGDVWRDVWIYYVGPFVGAAVAVLGALIGPPLYLLTPDWSLLLAGVIVSLWQAVYHYVRAAYEGRPVVIDSWMFLWFGFAAALCATATVVPLHIARKKLETFEF